MEKISRNNAVLLFILSVCISSIGATERPDMATHLADAWRVVTMAACGGAAGLLALIILRFSHLRIDASDQMVRPLYFVAIGYFLAIAYVCMDIASRFSLAISWRTPLATVAGCCMLAALKIISMKLRRALRGVNKNTTIKAAIIDTGQPGADRDLLDGD